jgi:hypothetical protein
VVRGSLSDGVALIAAIRRRPCSSIIASSFAKLIKQGECRSRDAFKQSPFWL